MEDTILCGVYGKPTASILQLSSKTYQHLKRLFVKPTVLTDGVNQRNSAEYHNPLKLIKDYLEYIGGKDIGRY